MSPLQELEAIIRKACPETLELKSGCWVDRLETGTKYRLAFTTQSAQGVYSFESEYGGVTSMYPGEFTILGSPLGLEHIFRAIEKSVPNATLLEVLYEKIIEVYKRYDLTKSLSSQSPACIEYLLKILR